MLPLQGIRIIAVEQYGAGPFGTLMLANMGAEIIKIEDPSLGGDVSRQVGPHFCESGDNSTDSLFFQGLNHNKRSFTLNLRSKEGKEILHKLVKTADALACNLRGDVPEKLGITYADLKPYNPKIVCAHLTAYGREGERKDWPGYDYPMQAESGYFTLTGEPDTPPSRFGLSIVDLSTGIAMGLALVSGLLNARTTGAGRDIDVSLFDVALYHLNYVAMWQLNAGHTQDRVPRSSHFSLTPCQLYKTQDDWIFIMCNKEKFWRVLCDKIDHPQLADDPRFNSFEVRLKNRDKLTQTLDDILQLRTTNDWLEHFNGDVPAAPILDVEQALSTPFVKNGDRIRSLQCDNGEELQVLASPIRSQQESLPLRRAPLLGEDTDALLKEIGLTEQQINKLRDNGIV